MRDYWLSWELKRAGIHWRKALLERWGLTGRRLLVAQIKADSRFTTEESSSHGFHRTRRRCRATYFNHAKKLKPRFDVPELTLKTPSPDDRDAKTDFLRLIRDRHRRLDMVRPTKPATLANLPYEIADQSDGFVASLTRNSSLPPIPTSICGGDNEAVSKKLGIPNSTRCLSMWAGPTPLRPYRRGQARQVFWLCDRGSNLGRIDPESNEAIVAWWVNYHRVGKVLPHHHCSQ